MRFLFFQFFLADKPPSFLLQETLDKKQARLSHLLVAMRATIRAEFGGLYLLISFLLIGEDKSIFSLLVALHFCDTSRSITKGVKQDVVIYYYFVKKVGSRNITL